MVVFTLYIAVPSSDLLDNGLATHQKRAFLNLQTTRNTLFSQSKHLFTILSSEIFRKAMRLYNITKKVLLFMPVE